MFKEKNNAFESEDLTKIEKHDLELITDCYKEAIVNALKSTKDISIYLDLLKVIQSEYLIILSIRDTPGNNLPDEIIGKIHDLGFTEFSNELWRTYIGISHQNTIICNKLGEVREASVDFEYKKFNKKMDLFVTSMAWRQGNKAEIIIDQTNYSVNLRGLNFVIYDCERDELIDSVGFDYHNKTETAFRRWFDVSFINKGTSQKKKNVLVEKIKSKPIVLIGGIEIINKFYKKFENVIHVKCVMLTEKTENESLLADKLKPLYSVYSLKNISADDYIICCCSENNYRDLILKLRNEFEYGKKYINYRLAQSLLDNKIIIMFLGYCQLDVIRDILSRIDSIKRSCDLYYFRLNTNTVSESPYFNDYIMNVMLCDILFYVPLFVQRGKTELNFMKYISENCKMYSFPRLAFRGLHPYKKENLETFNELTRIKDHVHWPFLYEEQYLDTLILEGRPNNEIYETVIKDDFISEVSIRRNLKLAFKMIEISEINTDLKMLDYIKENYQKKLLYRDGLHYQNCMYFEIVRRINKSMNLCREDEIDELEEKIKESRYEFIDFTEIPVLPCVAKALKLEYIDENCLYRVRNYDGTIQKMNIKEWIYSYCDYVRSVINIKKFFNQ